jgi:hypothetical protein
MTPKNPKIIHAYVSTAHFCKGYENLVAQELAFQFVRGETFGAYKIEGDKNYDQFMINCDQFGFAE